MLPRDLQGLVMSQTVRVQPNRSIDALACLEHGTAADIYMRQSVADCIPVAGAGGGRKRLCGPAAVLRSLRPAASSETIRGPKPKGCDGTQDGAGDNPCFEECECDFGIAGSTFRSDYTSLMIYSHMRTQAASHSRRLLCSLILFEQ